MRRILADYCEQHGWLRLHDSIRDPPQPGPTAGYCPIGDHMCPALWLVEEPHEASA